MLEEIKHKGFNEIRVFNPVYRRTLQIFYGDYQKLKEQIKLGRPDEEVRGYSICDTGLNVIYISSMTFDTLIHEIQHILFSWTNEIFTGQFLDIGVQEFNTYNMEFIISLVKKTKLWGQLERQGDDLLN